MNFKVYKLWHDYNTNPLQDQEDSSLFNLVGLVLLEWKKKVTGLSEVWSVNVTLK
jgi:hypothetical protein